MHSIEYIEVIPEWIDCKGRIARRDVDAFVALKWDRITGHSADAQAVLRTCDLYGVAFALVQEEVPEGDYRYLMTGV